MPICGVITMNEKASKLAIELFNKLKAFNDDKDFILGVMCNAPNDNDMKVILEFIDNGENVSVENLILLSLELGDNRERNSKK